MVCLVEEDGIIYVIIGEEVLIEILIDIFLVGESGGFFRCDNCD